MRRGANSEVARSLTAKNDAGQEYKERRKDVDRLVKELQASLKKHAKAQEDDPTNWGLVGDVNHVFAELTDIVKFLD